MLSCPRCDTGNLNEDRSLSMHLTRYCSGPSLLFHTQRGTLAKKRSHELMFSGSCPSTYQQQMRNFNSLMADVSVPAINTLHGMPSLSHLSSTQSKLGNCNVHYYGFDTDLSTPASVDDQIKPMIIQLHTLSLKNALFREIPYVYPLILHSKLIFCHK